jgi:hypothetical protein
MAYLGMATATARGALNLYADQALARRNLIGQAVGIVMERYRLGPDRAVAFLVRTSPTGNLRSARSRQPWSPTPSARPNRCDPRF